MKGKSMRYIERRVKGAIAVVVAVVMAAMSAVTLPPTTTKKVEAATKATEAVAATTPCYTVMNEYSLPNYNYWKLKEGTKDEYDIISCRHRGYYIAPDKPGKYPVLFLFHGTDGVGQYKNNIIATVNRWVALGYIEPMVIIMPEMEKIGDPSGSVEDTRAYIANGQFKKLLDQVKGGTFACSDKIDTSRDISAGGYSLGAAAALYVGQKYPDDIINIGACSPAIMAYMGEGKWGWINYEKDVRFSQNSRSHFLFGYGEAEPTFGENADRYNAAHEKNIAEDLDYNANSFVYYTGYPEGHVWNTFKREIFVFLYYVNTDSLPTTEVIEDACATTVLPDNGEGEKTEDDNPTTTTPTGDTVDVTPEPASTDKTNQDNQANNNSSTGSNNNANASDNNQGQANSSQQSGADNTTGSTTPAQASYSNEWHDGVWYNADGTTNYAGVAFWKSNGTGWWYEDNLGWYPTNSWQKIDGVWYHFDASGYMASSEWRDGYWLSSDGALTYAETASWKLYDSKWSYIDTSGWYPTSAWQKIDGSWYYFDSEGYIATNKKIDGYYLDANGVCQ